MSNGGFGARVLHRLQDRLLRLLGNQPERRVLIVQEMLHRDDLSLRSWSPRFVS